MIKFDIDYNDVLEETAKIISNSPDIEEFVKRFVNEATKSEISRPITNEFESIMRQPFYEIDTVSLSVKFKDGEEVKRDIGICLKIQID